MSDLDPGLGPVVGPGLVDDPIDPRGSIEEPAPPLRAACFGCGVEENSIEGRWLAPGVYVAAVCGCGDDLVDPLVANLASALVAERETSAGHARGIEGLSLLVARLQSELARSLSDAQEKAGEIATLEIREAEAKLAAEQAVSEIQRREAEANRVFAFRALRKVARIARFVRTEIAR